MFESAELGHAVDKAAFDKEEPELRAELLRLQNEVRAQGRFSVIVLINGMDGAGRGETINKLNEWMDPRFIESRAFPDPSDEERERPEMWRYWRALPAKGRIGVLFGSWYSDVVRARLSGKVGEDECQRRLSAINRFEQMLSDEGVLLIKFWFHLSKKGQKARLTALENDPKTRWRVSKDDWARFKQYDQYVSEAERLIRFTSKGNAPWIIIDGSDERYRALKVGRVLRDALSARLARTDGSRRVAEAPIVHSGLDPKNLLSALDLSKTVAKKKYEEELVALQERIGWLARHPKFARRALVLVFEGNDAAGKGGAIRRVTAGLDARQYEVIPIAAPSDEERAQSYLWRFWRRVPRHGRIAIFDRSWYGRVLVERVEGFCTQADWMRAYAEINDFEAQLAQNNDVVVKFWLQISKEEQLARFQLRESSAFKRFKITAEDWRNREKWDAYEIAADDMIERTSTEIAPWTLVEANDKYYARIKVLTTLNQRIQQALDALK